MLTENLPFHSLPMLYQCCPVPT